MKLALIRFDDMVTVPGGKVLGNDMIGDACESTFRSADGWEIDETAAQGVFTLRATHMPAPFVVGGYGYGYLVAPIEPVDTEAPKTLSGEWAKQAKAKKR